jgi:hypothetical protein
MAEEESVPVTTVVEQQEGERVLLSVPMIGFPPGFKLRAGERVVLTHDAAGPAVRPLVREVKVDSLAEEAAGALSVGGQSLATQASTIRDLGRRGPYVVSIVDRGSAQGPEQVIAIRSAG